MHNRSPRKDIIANPLRFTTHHVRETGQPPYIMHMKRCIIYNVAEKSRHFFDLSITYDRYPALLETTAKKKKEEILTICFNFFFYFCLCTDLTRIKVYKGQLSCSLLWLILCVGYKMFWYNWYNDLLA
jgi:hypothetical protein